LNQPTIRPRESCREAKIGEAAAARDLAQLHVVGRANFAKLPVEFLKCLQQRRALPRLDSTFADSRGSKSRGRTK
jgi:hypothetical protein